MVRQIGKMMINRYKNVGPRIPRPSSIHVSTPISPLAKKDLVASEKLTANIKMAMRYTIGLPDTKYMARTTPIMM